MNLILCGKKCVNQKDGYCTLKGVSMLQTTEKDCLYFQKGSPENIERNLLSQMPENLADGPEPHQLHGDL